MNVPVLSAAVVSSAQITRMSHPLAAANHRQWILWERWVLRDPSMLAAGDASAIIENSSTQEFESMLARNASTVLSIVKGIVGGFAYEPDVQQVVERKRSQFNGWVEYAVTQTPDKRARWLLQCRTAFLALPPDMQKSDYVEAGQDLVTIAGAGGLVLADPVPELKPQTPRHLRRLRSRHAIGMHGLYVDSEANWSNICIGCHRSWSMSY